MSLSEFEQLQPSIQVFVTHTWGTYLAPRWEAGELLVLYYFADEQRGFFVELGYQASQRGIAVRQRFVHAGPLANYCHYVKLPAW